MIYFLAAWAILMVFFGAICMASRRREVAELDALSSIGVQAPEPEFAVSRPTPERRIEDFGRAVKAH